MKSRIIPFSAFGSVNAVPSKSYAHRFIILSALSKGRTFIENVGSSEDVRATISCVASLGAKVNYDGLNVEIFGIEEPTSASLDFGESGSTMRFIIPMVSALGVNAQYTGHGKLLFRPNEILFDILEKNGVVVKDNKIQGKLFSGNFEIDSSVSSQYISGLIMALSYINGESVIYLKGRTVSKDYINITLDSISQFGVKYQTGESYIKIFGGTLNSPSNLKVEGDWSNVAFPLALGALTGRVTVCGVNLDSVQGDRVILNLFEKAGIKLSQTKNSVTAEKSRIIPIEADLRGCPDLAPIISTVLAYANGTSVLRGVEGLKIKESDRLSAIIDNLTKAKIEAFYDGSALYIKGGKPKANLFEGYNDHRMVMSSCVMASGVNGESEVSDCQAVKKSYPNFFKDFKILGGNHVDI